MTGDELRKHLAAAKIGPTQFAEAVADAKGLTAYKQRNNAVRAAKRWISAEKADEHLRLSPRNQEAAAKAAQLPVDALTPPDRQRASSRLEELAVKVEFLVERETQFSKDLDDARTRLAALEQRRRRPPAAPKHQGNTP